MHYLWSELYGSWSTKCTINGIVCNLGHIHRVGYSMPPSPAALFVTARLEGALEWSPTAGQYFQTLRLQCFSSFLSQSLKCLHFSCHYTHPALRGSSSLPCLPLLCLTRSVLFHLFTHFSNFATFVVELPHFPQASAYALTGGMGLKKWKSVLLGDECEVKSIKVI